MREVQTWRAMRRACLCLTLASSIALGGCGTQGTKTVTVTAPAASQSTTPPTPTTAVSRPSRRSGGATRLANPAQSPDPGTSVSCSEAPVGHACISGTTAPSNPNQFPQRNCDTNVVANSATSCGLAENAFYEYFEDTQTGGDGSSISVHSPVTGKDYDLFCDSSDGLIACTGEPLATGIYLSFPESAIAAYSPEQADAYARTHDVGSPAAPSSGGAPSTAPPSGSPEGIGSYSHSDDAGFCSAHDCIGSFDTEPGYIVECADGTYSHAGGISGSCSRHGGNG